VQEFPKELDTSLARIPISGTVELPFDTNGKTLTYKTRISKVTFAYGSTWQGTAKPQSPAKASTAHSTPVPSSGSDSLPSH